MNIFYIQDGDLLFKDTDFKDKGKKFSMKLANFFTSKLQGVDDRDHCEFFHWEGEVLCVTSSVHGAGVRTQSFANWIIREGYPKIEILRKPIAFTTEEMDQIRVSIRKLLGNKYGLKKALKSRLSINDAKIEKDFKKSGIFCSEVCSYLSGFENWVGDWPIETYNKAVARDYSRYCITETKNMRVMQWGK